MEHDCGLESRFSEERPEQGLREAEVSSFLPILITKANNCGCILRQDALPVHCLDSYTGKIHLGMVLKMLHAPHKLTKPQGH
jgi:hypothetical protein